MSLRFVVECIGRVKKFIVNECLTLTMCKLWIWDESKTAEDTDVPKTVLIKPREHFKKNLINI